jgi:hypothetical protein
VRDYRGVGFTVVLPFDREGQGTRVREGDLAPTDVPSIQLRDSAGFAPASPGSPLAYQQQPAPYLKIGRTSSPANPQSHTDQWPMSTAHPVAENRTRDAPLK